MDELKKKRAHIRNLMRYAVPDEEIDAALDLLIIFREDRIALAVLDEFYSFLPDAKNDWIKEFRLVGRRQGVFLLAAVASENIYLYLVSGEGIEFNGSLNEGWLDRDLCDFFGFSKAAFEEAARQPENLPEYQPLQADVDICPACQAGTGELHELGCPVEVCPWCGGQLVHCSCRFDQLGLDELVDEVDLIRLEELLADKGRLAYSPEQRPSFADEGPGIEFD